MIASELLSSPSADSPRREYTVGAPERTLAGLDCLAEDLDMSLSIEDTMELAALPCPLICIALTETAGTSARGSLVIASTWREEPAGITDGSETCELWSMDDAPGSELTVPGMAGEVAALRIFPCGAPPTPLEAPGSAGLMTLTAPGFGAGAVVARRNFPCGAPPTPVAASGSAKDFEGSTMLTAPGCDA